MNIIFCRNVMIYFDKPTQAKLVDGIFARAIHPDGYLFIGHSESLSGFTKCFALRIGPQGAHLSQEKGKEDPVIRVMVVDDSALVRRIATDILTADPEITVVATAAQAEFALLKLDKEKPDVITLDLEMPGMGGLEAIRRIMAMRPTPDHRAERPRPEGRRADAAGPRPGRGGLRAQAVRPRSPAGSPPWRRSSSKK